MAQGQKKRRAAASVAAPAAASMQLNRSLLLQGAGLVALTLVAVAYILYVQQSLTGNFWGLPVDDAYIHLRFAQNLASGHGFAFNPDQPVPGSTSPLWVFLLALPALAGVPVWLAAKCYGVFFLAITVVLVWRLARRVIDMPAAAWLAAALTAVDGRLLWAAPSGMEVTLFAALSVAALNVRLALDDAPVGQAEIAGRRDSSPVPVRMPGFRGDAAPLLWLAGLCGLATLARPEGYLLALVLGVDLLLRRRPPLPLLALCALLYLLLALPYDIFALATTGHALPTTFYAKVRPPGAATLPTAVSYLISLCLLLIAGNPALLFAPLGAWVLWQRGSSARLLVLWPLALIAEQAIISPVLYHFGRYVMPLEPFFALWAVAGIMRLTRESADRGRMILPAVALLLLSLFTMPQWAARYALSVRDITDMHVALGRWVRAHVPPGQPVALNDIGAISYVSGHPAIDIEGLVTPRFIALKHEQSPARRARAVLQAVRQMGGRYLILFPTVYPALAAQPALHPVYSVRLHQTMIVPAPVMTVYAIR